MAIKMKATVLVDNIEANDIPGEWGLCLFIEHNGKKILLDTGASDLFLNNAERLGISPEDADYAVLSHAHFDHSDGLEAFFKINRHAKCYIQKDTAENCYFKMGFIKKYIGLPKGILEKYSGRFQRVGSKERLDEGIWLVPHTTPGLKKIGAKERMYRKTADGWLPDDFSHEQSLVLETEKGLVIFNCCSHGGAVNIIREIQNAFPGKKVYALIGGFHIFRKRESEIRNLAGRLGETGIEYICTGHCSGKRGFSILHDELGERVHQLKTGLVMEF